MRVPVILAILLSAALAAAQADATGDGISIAVLDSGIDSGHSEFTGRVTRQSFIEAGGTSLPGGLGSAGLWEDPDGQGTAVASVAAGSALGLAPAADLIDLQVTVGRQLGEQIDPDDERATIAALDWLLQQGQDAPRVVVISVAARPLSSDGAATIAQQARGLHALGVAVVVPVAPQWSALHASPYVLTVGGLADGKPVGPAGPEGLAKPDIVAPSRELDIAIAGGPGGVGRSQGAGTGTHLAAGLAAGTLATLFELQPRLPVAAALDILRDTAADVAAPGFDAETGFGLLDPGAAQIAADAWTDPLRADAGRDAPASGLLSALAVSLAAAGTIRRRR